MSARLSARRLSLRARRLIEGLEQRCLFDVSAIDLAPSTGAQHHTGGAYGINTDGTIYGKYDGKAAYWVPNGDGAYELHDLGFKGRLLDGNYYGDVIVGGDSSTGTERPLYLYEDQAMHPTLRGRTAGVINAVNSNGVAVGTFAGTATSPGSIGFITDSSGRTYDVGVPFGFSGVELTGINYYGQIFGTAYDSSTGQPHAFLLKQNRFQFLDQVTSENGQPASTVSSKAINDYGEVIVAADGQNAFVVGDEGEGDVHDRGRPLENVAAGGRVVTDSNESGVFLVNTNFATREAFVNYEGSTYVNLNELDNADGSSGLHIETANALNDAGQIVGEATDANGDLKPYVLIDRPLFDVSGQVFNDINGDGYRDADEPRVAQNLTVFIDDNRDGELDEGEVQVPYTVDGESGQYRFENLSPGYYSLGVVAPEGYELSTPYGDPYLNVDVYDSDVTNFDLGIKVIKPPTYSLSGQLFDDKNSNGVKDYNENGTGSRTVFLDTDGDGVLDAGEISTQSDSWGYYEFDGLEAGTYNVSRVFPSGFSLSNGGGKKYITRTIVDSDVYDADLGSKVNKPAPVVGAITGFLFNDLNKNGKFDANDTRTGARTVFIDANGNGKLDNGERSVISDSNGVYTISGLLAGTYKVTRVFPAGYKLSNNSAGYVTVSVSAGKTTSGVNLGSRTV